MRRLPLVLFVALCVLVLSLAYAWWQLFQTKKAIDVQLKHNQELIYRNAALQADIQDLRNGDDAVQERARMQLGMIKRDEVFVQVMDQPSAVQPASTTQITGAAPAPEAAPPANPSNPAPANPTPTAPAKP